jgi:hypothetical protein
MGLEHVGAAATHCLPITPVSRPPPPVPVSVVDLVDIQRRLQDQRVADHRVVRWVSVLMHLQVPLNQ